MVSPTLQEVQPDPQFVTTTSAISAVAPNIYKISTLTLLREKLYTKYTLHLSV